MKIKKTNDTMRATIRRDKRMWLVLFLIFVSMFLFSFLVQKYKNSKDVEAVSLSGFDPGYIISDWQMGNYNSMSEAEIQAFLTAKNPCENRDNNYYVALSRNTNYRWHFEDGHFICLSEERFGYNDNEIGFQYRESAAHIIWQAAQDYHINPQVLLVLLQKETGLVTDPVPNNGDYRKATGFGCPDTAACSSKYYGFRNQIRNAAALFRTVLNGGWTNYPLGNNYIQYNPNAACGGSVVNVRSLATSALYRYTPYQPNSGALNAGYGTASCGAYGNRNFYLYFEDWFGGITSGSLIKKYYEGAGGPSGWLGEAIMENEYCGLINGGCYQSFKNGSVYWSPMIGVHSVSGAILDRWVELGTEWGRLKYPVGDEILLSDGSRRQQFETGYIYWTEATGSWDVSGGIFAEYVKEGTEWGILGYPTSGEKVDASGTVYQSFEHGTIYWTKEKGAWVEL